MLQSESKQSMNMSEDGSQTYWIIDVIGTFRIIQLQSETQKASNAYNSEDDKLLRNPQQ